MNWASSWHRLQDIARRWAAARASREQLAAWLAREHKRDPIHK